MATLYPMNVVRVSLEGTCFGANEIWQTGFWLGNPTQHAEAPTIEKAEAIAQAFSQFFTNVTSSITSSYRFTTVRMTYHLALGGIDRDATVIYDLPTPVTGSASGTSQQAPQIATVATLMTALPRGRGSKGRMFLPCNGASVDSTGHISTTVQTNIATNLGAFLGAVDIIGSGQDDVVNVSPLRAIPAFPGRIQIVLDVRVGNVYDTQRRRRNDIGEQYVIRPLTP